MTRNFAFLINTNISKKLQDKITNLEEAVRLKKIEKSVTAFRKISEELVLDICNELNIEFDHTRHTSLGQKIKYIIDIRYPVAYVRHALTTIQNEINNQLHHQNHDFELEYTQLDLIRQLKNLYIILKWAVLEIWKGNISENKFDEYLYLSRDKVEDTKVITEKDVVATKEEISGYTDVINMHPYPIGKFIIEDSRKYIIPVYQRDYRWPKDVCKILWKDIVEVSNNKNKNEHFFGTIATTVVDNNNNVKKVRLMDGRQRITTSILLFKAIIDNLKIKKGNIPSDFQEYFSKNPKDIIQASFDNEESKAVFDIILKTTQKTYEKQVASLGQYKDTAYARNYLYFFEELSKLNLEQIDKILYKFAHSFVIGVISINCTKVEEMEIFESINSKGTSLTTLELIKNVPHEFLTDEEINDPEDEAKIAKNFNEIFKIFQIKKNKKGEVTADHREIFIETFIKSKIANVLPSSKESVNKNLLKEYNSIFKKWLEKSNKLDNKYIKIQDYADWMEHLKPFAKLYNDVQKKNISKDKESILYDHRYFIEKCPKIISSILPVIFAFVNEFATWSKTENKWRFLNNGIKDHFDNWLRTLEKHFIFLTITEGMGVSDAKAYLSLIKDLKNVETKNMYSETEYRLENLELESFRTPSLNNVLDKLKDSDILVGRKSAVSLLLININNYLMEKQDGFTYPEAIDPQLEHILPQKPNKWAQKVFESSTSSKSLEKIEEQLLSKVNNLGNLTILPAKLNGGASNKLLEEKLENYGESKYHPTLMDRNNFNIWELDTLSWNKEMINKRTNFMIKKIKEYYTK